MRLNDDKNRDEMWADKSFKKMVHVENIFV